MTDTINRQDAVAAIEAERLMDETCTNEDAAYERGLDDAIAAINALPAAECKQCSDLVKQINGYKDALSDADGRIAMLEHALQYGE